MRRGESERAIGVWCLCTTHPRVGVCVCDVRKRKHVAKINYAVLHFCFSLLKKRERKKESAFERCYPYVVSVGASSETRLDGKRRS